ncbi:hypothetical protein, partial [Klebsiella pneumoniae]|uniref:hypothetical protein n=1 Tax=Klebsiella pneumoniae TaxID=573 RepID=UPI001E3C3ECE
MRSFVRTLAWLLLLSTAGSAWAASPVLSVITPRGAQRGAETELTFHGARLADAQEIFFYEPGFEVVKLEAADGAVKAVVKVAPDCRLGEHVAQVRTASGISEYRSLFVGPYPAVAEVEPNSLFEQPQAIELNATVEGI